MESQEQGEISLSKDCSINGQNVAKHMRTLHAVFVLQPWRGMHRAKHIIIQ
jgi:hypothetical protein